MSRVRRIIVSLRGEYPRLPAALICSFHSHSRSRADRNINCNSAGTPLLRTRNFRPGDHVDIRFISSLTPEDEDAFAPALLRAVAAVLDQFPIAYTVRIETTGAQVLQHTHPSFDGHVAAPAPARVALRAVGGRD